MRTGSASIGLVVLGLVLAVPVAAQERRNPAEELGDALKRLADAFGQAKESREAARAWDRAVDLMCSPAQEGFRNYGQLIGEIGLRLAIHRHTPATLRVVATSARSGDETVFRFTCEWTTSLLATRCVTEFTARVSEARFHGVSLVRDSSGKWGAQNTERLTAFLRDALWGTIKGFTRPLPAARVQELQANAISLFQAGFGSLVPYANATLPCVDAQGNRLILFVYFWEAGALATNQLSIVRWRVGSAPEVDSTKAPSRPESLESYCRDILGPSLPR